jgi:hypothetical protein
MRLKILKNCCKKTNTRMSVSEPGQFQGVIVPRLLIFNDGDKV